MEFDMEENKQYLNLKESAQLLGISEKLMTKLSHQKGFPCIRFSRRVVIHRGALEQWFLCNSNKFIR